LQTKEGTSYFTTCERKIYSFSWKETFLLRPLGNVFYVVPPYVIKEEELKPNLTMPLRNFFGNLISPLKSDNLLPST